MHRAPVALYRGFSRRANDACRIAITIGSTVLLAAVPAAGAGPGDPLRVLVFGDSLSAGYGLVEGEGFVDQLQAWLDAHGGGATLINAGVSGDTTAGGAARIEWALGDGATRPDAAIVELGGNDMLRGLPPERAKENLAAILRALRARGIPVLLVGMRAPDNLGPDYKAAFDAIYPDLARQFGVALFPDFFAGLAGLGPRDRVIRRYMQPDATHPNAEGVAHIVDAIGPAVLDLVARARQGGASAD